jgi:hypothetical protein
MTYEEAMVAYEAECDEIARQCQEEGYPSHGSTYEMRIYQAYRYWMGLVDEED